MKIDLHIHSSEVSPCGRLTVEDLLELYSKTDYDGFVLTNHFSAYACGKAKEKVRSFALPIIPFSIALTLAEPYIYSVDLSFMYPPFRQERIIAVTSYTLILFIEKHRAYLLLGIASYLCEQHLK